MNVRDPDGQRRRKVSCSFMFLTFPSSGRTGNDPEKTRLVYEKVGDSLRCLQSYVGRSHRSSFIFDEPPTLNVTRTFTHKPLTDRDSKERRYKLNLGEGVLVDNTTLN